MSLYSAMYAGVSGLKVQSSAMGAIGDNIANVNTVGYKDSQVDFQTLVTKQTSSTTYSAGGVFSKTTQNVDTQGTLSASSSTTDIALSGEGFFVCNTVSEPANVDGLMCYTRAGSFSTDEDGYLVNTAGYYLMGWPLMQANGSEPSSSIVDVGGTDYTRAYVEADGDRYYVNTNVVDRREVTALNLNELGGTAEQTLNIALGANLPADHAIGTEVETTVSVYDKLGITHNVDWTWEKSAANTWDLSMMPPSGSATISALNENGTTGNNAYYAAGQIEFTGEFDATAQAALVGASITINGTAYTFANAADVAGDNTIGIANATSWEDVCTIMAAELNTDDLAATAGYFGTDAAGAAGTAGGPNDDGKRFFVDGNRVVMVQSGNGTAISVSAFTDNAAGALSTYCLTMGVSGGAFTVSTLDPAGNYWGADVNADGDTTDAGDIPNIAAAVFNGDGTPDTINVHDMEVRWANGAQDMTGDNKVNLFFGNENLTDGLTQLSAPYQVNYLTQDGAKFGNFAGVEIDTDGVVTALFDNGVRTPIFQIPVATFVNPNGLESLSGNAWIQTDSSGSYTLHIAGTAGAGVIEDGALESSTVDLSTEFTDMIVTQRAYSAASKVITTANEMMDDLMAIIR